MPAKKFDIEKLNNRKGAIRRSEVPRDVLDALNSGVIESRTLVEWLAMDLGKLLGNVCDDIGLKKEKRSVLAEYKKVEDEGIAKRHKVAGAILFAAIKNRDDGDAIFEALATHAADVPRSLAAYAVMADQSLTLSKRLKGSRRFAADPNMVVRETAWDSYRPYLAKELRKGIKLLERWAVDKDANIRRCAVESSRPCGVWTAHIPELKAKPEIGLPLLEPVRSDPSRYVQNAVGNWLNDASKTRPEWVVKLCRRWEEESATTETKYIVRRGLRTLRKQGLA
jgi:3-methyladenine DNA glycosylase AlkC